MLKITKEIKTIQMILKIVLGLTFIFIYGNKSQKK